MNKGKVEQLIAYKSTVKNKKYENLFKRINACSSLIHFELN